jgi:hypothetical protein
VLACDQSHRTALGELIDQHIAALQATADAVQGSEEGRTTASALVGVAQTEAAIRLAIINYSPQGEEEVSEKLTYFAAYLIATGNTLTAHEMNSILQGSRGLMKALVN